MKKVSYALILFLLLIPSLVLSADILPKALEYIVSMQKPNGAWNNNTAHTAFPLLAPSQVNKGAQHLAKEQMPDGAYVSDVPQQFDKKAKKNTQTTCFAAWALSEAR